MVSACWSTTGTNPWGLLAARRIFSKSTSATVPSSSVFTRKSSHLGGTDLIGYSGHRHEHPRRHGHPGASVLAYVLCGLMSEPPVDFLGASWFRTGSISLTFIGVGVAPAAG